MKHVKLIILGILLAGVLLTPAQQTEPKRSDLLPWRQAMAGYAELSTEVKAQGDKFAAAADYLKLALVLGLGMLMGRMSAVSSRELAELKAAVKRLVSSSHVTASEIKMPGSTVPGEINH